MATSTHPHCNTSTKLFGRSHIGRCEAISPNNQWFSSPPPKPAPVVRVAFPFIKIAPAPSVGVDLGGSGWRWHLVSGVSRHRLGRGARPGRAALGGAQMAYLQVGLCLENWPFLCEIVVFFWHTSCLLVRKGGFRLQLFPAAVRGGCEPEPSMSNCKADGLRVGALLSRMHRGTA